MRAGFLLFFPALAACNTGEEAEAPPQLILWAWERPEDLRFAGQAAEVAFQAGFIEIAGDELQARGRRFPLKSAVPPTTVLIHVQIDHQRALDWTPRLRQRVSAAVLHYAGAYPAPRVQIDFEVRESERPILLEILQDVRRGLPPGTIFSMTALASWCDSEDWLEQAPVDEVVPMLFRMQKGGEAIRKRLAAGRDFHNPKCRTALAISSDSPILRAPPGRRVYLFNPRSWNASDFRKVRASVAGWR